MSGINCVYTPKADFSYCIVCPELPAITAVVGSTTVDRRLGWNAEARSVASHAGDCFTQFTIPANVVGVICGFGEDTPEADPRDILHGFYIYQEAGKQLWRVVESADPKTAPVVRVPATDLFRIEKRAGVVRYFFNNRVLYTSLVRSDNEVVVVASLYAAGDGVD